MGHDIGRGPSIDEICLIQLHSIITRPLHHPHVRSGNLKLVCVILRRHSMVVVVVSLYGLNVGDQLSIMIYGNSWGHP
jgi:hypothetical protein